MGLEEFLLDRAKKEGIREGISSKSVSFVQSLLTETDFTAAKIASLVGVSEDFVNEIKAKLEA